MKMITFIFFFFLAAVLFILKFEEHVLKDQKKIILFQKWTLLIASFLFISYANIWFSLILLIQAVITWYCARKKSTVPAGIVLMILFLGIFKYTNFFLQSFSSVIGSDDPVLLKIILPLGISFYTFSAISYLADVQKGKQTSLGLSDVALYLSFFPKLTSGPIQRSQEFFSQIDHPRSINSHCLSMGIQIFVFGVFKKLVLADNLSVFVNQVYRTPMAFDSFTIMLAAVSYSMQIYFDFSGYSDMAIGVGKMLDIDLPRNFDLPYLAHNVTELWKRWHITLSSWLQEYLYFPLGGNRKGTVRTYCNLILTMMIGGFWHGASWTYIVWGTLHGIGLAVHKIWSQYTGSRNKKHTLPGNILSITVTFLFTTLCWIFFRADSLSHAVLIITRMLSMQDGIRQPYLWTWICGLILMGASILAAVKSTKSSAQSKSNQSPVHGYYPIVNLNSFWGLVGFFTFCGLILTLAYTGGSPFIYGAY